MKSKFFPNKTALITLVAACFVVNVTMGVRQTFGLFSGDFEIDCGISNTEFGLAVSYTHLRSPRDLSTSRMPSSA